VNRHRRALSTGQAARHCLVTADTVANWIRGGLLPAQRTAGGQYRILAEDLRAFMSSRGMSTESLGEGARSTGTRPPCWESRTGSSDREARCDECIVKHLKALDCFKLMGMRAADGGPARDCAECAYFLQYGRPELES